MQIFELCHLVYYLQNKLLMTRMIEQGQPQPQKYEKMGTVKTFDPSLINVSPTSAVENWIPALTHTLYLFHKIERKNIPYRGQ